MRLEIELPNADGRLRPGMYAQVTLHPGPAASAATGAARRVNVDAVRWSGGRPDARLARRRETRFARPGSAISRGKDYGKEGLFAPAPNRGQFGARDHLHRHGLRGPRGRAARSAVRRPDRSRDATRGATLARGREGPADVPGDDGGRSAHRLPRRAGPRHRRPRGPAARGIRRGPVREQRRSGLPGHRARVHLPALRRGQPERQRHAGPDQLQQHPPGDHGAVDREPGAGVLRHRRRPPAARRLPPAVRIRRAGHAADGGRAVLRPGARAGEGRGGPKGRGRGDRGAATDRPAGEGGGRAAGG